MLTFKLSLRMLAFLMLAVSLAAFQGAAQAQQIISGSPGDTITYHGEGPVNSDVTLEVSSSTSIGVSGGSYSSSLNGINIPSGSNRFSISVSPVQTMHIAGGPSWLGSVASVDGSVSGTTGSYSISNVPAGSYNIRVYGTPANGASSVTMTVTASAPQHVGADGHYTASISTAGLPPGVYTVRQNGQEVAIVYLGVPAPATPTPTAAPVANATANPSAGEESAISPSASAIPHGSPSAGQPSATESPSPSTKISEEINGEKAVSESGGLDIMAIAIIIVILMAIAGAGYIILERNRKR